MKSSLQTVAPAVLFKDIPVGLFLSYTDRKWNIESTKGFPTLRPMIIISDLEAKGNSDLVRKGNSVLVLCTSQMD